MTTALIVYLITVIVAAGCSLVAWGICYAGAALNPSYSAARTAALRDARTCLLAVPKSLIWPHYAVRSLVRAVHTTLRGDDS